jgi:4-hydroxy-3-polyprenylbenzoate decarboxylase
LTSYILDRFTPKSLFVTEGILDALDHSSAESLVGGKLGIDVTAAHKVEAPELLGDEELFEKVRELVGEVVSLHQYMRRTKNPITVISIDKKRDIKSCFEALLPLTPYLRIVVFVDSQKNDIYNPYMLVWRVTNNIDVLRDLFISGLVVGLDATNKGLIDGFEREWPDDVECTPSVIESLKQRGLWDLDEKLLQKYQL